MLRAFKYNICKYTIETIICFYFIVHRKINKIIGLFVDMYMYLFLQTSIRYFDQFVNIFFTFVNFLIIKTTKLFVCMHGPCKKWCPNPGNENVYIFLKIGKFKFSMQSSEFSILRFVGRDKTDIIEDQYFFING